MHRTTTTAALLVTVAVSALSGCTTVPHRPAPGPPPPPPTAPARHPDHATEPQVVQAPAREALELVAPSPRPATSPTPAPPPRDQPAHRSQAHPAPRAETPGRSPEHRPDDPPHPASRPARPSGPTRPAAPAPPEIPDVSRTVREQTDVCALGTRYGGWRPGSPESVTCEKVYGHR